MTPAYGSLINLGVQRGWIKFPTPEQLAESARAVAQFDDSQQANQRRCMARLRARREAMAVLNFNKVNSIGCAVRVIKRGGRTIETTTTSEAQMLNGRSAVIFLRGVSGCYSLHRVHPIV